MPILQPRSELQLHSRCENQIENEIDRRPFRAGDRILSEDYKRRYQQARHRPTEPSPKYNCHGLTFGSRRTWICKASEVAKVLQDDGYVEIQDKHILPGDIVVYFNLGDAEHSGIVVENQPVPLVLSKWGRAHEVIHKLRECPYDSMEIRYYRIQT